MSGSTSENASVTAIRPRYAGLLFLLVLAACVARLVGLDHLLVWHDEVFTLVRVFGYSENEVLRTLFSGDLLDPAQLLQFQTSEPGRDWGDTLAAFREHPEHAPLYYALGRLATALPFSPIVSLRGLSAVSGILLIPACYWLMRELFGRGLIPLVSATLIAFSPLHYLYAQEARQYALWVLLVVAASAALHRALRRDRGTDWFLYTILVTIGLYAHLLFALLIPVHAIFGYFANKSDRARFLSQAGRWAMATAAAFVAFLPWLAVVLTNAHRVEHSTAWMKRPLGLDQIAIAWGQHLVRMILDPAPDAVSGRWLLLVPILWSLAYFIRRAPRPGAWLLILIAAAYLSAVLFPDLALGGSRSHHVRYALPGALALHLMVAWVIGCAIQEGSRASRLSGYSALAAAITLGGLSLAAIQHSTTWWNKVFSANNGEVARILNAGERPLVVASDYGISAGELISLAYLLDDRVRIWGERKGKEPIIPAGFGETISLTPSVELKSLLERDHDLVSVGGTWQWVRAMPRRRPIRSALDHAEH